MKPYVIAIAVIVVVVGALNGRSVRYGLLLDDYNHRAELREGDFSFRSLVDASHLGGEGRRVEMWWQDEADQHFFRPLSFFMMRAQYVVGGWRPGVMHAFSLGWTVIGAVLVMMLGRMCLASLPWACLAAVLFVIHPGNYLTGRWIACQNEQMVTVFILLGLLCYGLWSGWRWNGDVRVRDGGSGYLLGAVLCFVSAMGCRENSIVFAPLVVAGDWLLRPGRFKGRWWFYAVLAVLVVGYLAIRHAVLGGFAMPGYPYAYPVGEPGFLQFVVDKLVYYILGLFACFPIVGFEGLTNLRSEPAFFYGAFAVVFMIWAGFVWWFRQNRILAFWMLLAIIPLGPVLPVFASAHHLYLPSVGLALASVCVARWVIRWSFERQTQYRQWVRKLAVVLVGVHVLVYAGATVIYDSAFAGFSYASQQPVKEVAELGGSMKAGDRLFFINLPLLGFNCIPGIEESAGVSRLKGYALTFSSGLLTMDQVGRVERVGQRQLRVSLGGDGYFSGLSGAKMMEAIGRDGPFAVGERFSTADFDVEIVRANDAGVNELLFTFRRPIDDESYHFFFGSPRFCAYPLRF